MERFTHIDDEGRVRMVDVTEKPDTLRTARARGVVTMQRETFERIKNHQVKKGNVLETARIAGVMAAKKTAELIPMCHPLYLSHIAVDFIPDPEACAMVIEATAKLKGQTGVEMEALTAVSVAALTIYDMCKSYDRAMTLTDIQLVEKSGGKSGTFKKE
jgi:cyclic pyranopterin monophosphate synthase